MAGRQLWVSMIVCVFAAMGVLGFAGSPAFAFEAHVFEGSFGSEGVFGSHFPQGRPGALGVDQVTGGIYVADGFYDDTVQKFNLDHEPEPFTGIAPNISGNKLGGFGISFWQLAVSATNQDLYVASGPSVRAFQPDGEPADFTAGPGAGTNELPGSEVCGVAVDSSGDIYVSEYSTGVSVFSSSGEPLAKIAASGVCGLAVDSKGTVYVNVLPAPEQGQSGSIEKLMPSGPPPVTSSTTYEAVGTVDANPSFAVAVNPDTNHLYVDEGNQIAVYDEVGARVGTFGSSEPGALPSPERYGTGLAVNGASGRVYVGQGDFNGQIEVFGPAILLPDVTTGKASEIDPKETATVNGGVNPDGVEVAKCFFEYGTSRSYGQQAECEPKAVGSGSSEVYVSAKLKELEPGKTYHFRLVASNKTALNTNPANHGSDETFNTPPRPSIDTTSNTNLAASSVDLNAQVNPGGLDTTYHIEYGTSTEYGTNVPVPDADIGVGSADVSVTQHVESLSPNVTYHWRVVATNAAGTTTGADHTFIYDTSGEGLPDRRAYEMVTPPHKNASLIGAGTHITQVSEDGLRVSAVTIQCFGDAESCDPLLNLNIGQPELFTRGSSGWMASALQPPAREFASDGYLKSDPNTGMALFSIPTSPMFEDDMYAREPSGGFVDVGPLTPPSEGPQPEPFSSAGKGADVNATSDFSHVAYENATLGRQAVQYSGFSDQAPNLVGVSGGQGSEDLISGCGTALGNFYEVFPGEMSEDGETVYFTAGSSAGGCAAGGTGANAGKVVPVNELFARVGGGTANAHTVALSEPSAFSAAAPYPGCEKEPCVKDVNEQANWRGAEFEGASADGSEAFFLSDQQLTDNASEGQGNLYEYDFDDPSEEGRLIDVSAGDTSGLGPQMQGVLAISSDGSHVYFVADGVLSSAPNGLGEAAKVGADNLYVFERDTSYPDGRIAFVTQLAESDGEEWGGRVPPGYERNSLQGDANVTPDGRYLVFESRGRLTPDTTRPEGGPTQIYRYDAQTGELVRVSIGERGFNDNGNAGLGDAQIVPQGFVGQFFAPAGPSRSDPTMSNDGQYIFFESPIGLTPHALNDVQIGTRGEIFRFPVFAENVYEWHEGQVHLISDGKDTSVFANEQRSSVSLVGSDATGANVFFTTADPLVAKDTDTQIDIYDARICEPERGNPCISEPLPALPPCQGEACHGTPAGTPAAPGAPTVTFNGQGNLSGSASASEASKPTGRRGKQVARCRRGERRAHGVCVKKKRKQDKRKKTRTARIKGRPAGKTTSGKRGG